MIRLDRRLEGWIVAHRIGALDGLSLDLSRIGRLGFVWLALALVLALASRRVAVFLQVLVADGLADGLADLVKAVVPRARPSVRTLGPRLTSHSFPSGHSATSFACATVLAAWFPRARPAFYALAAAIALSRLYNGDHFPLDVLAGAALGCATALLLRAAVRRRRPRARRGARSRSRSRGRRPAGPSRGSGRA